MTIASSRAHADAVVAQLNAAGVVAYLSEAAAGHPETYVVVHPSPGFPAGTIGDRFAELLMRFQTTSVGAGPAQAQWTHDKVAAALTSGLPVLAGRTVHPIWMDEEPQPVRRDDTLANPLFYAVARWVLHTSL